MFSRTASSGKLECSTLSSSSSSTVTSTSSETAAVVTRGQVVSERTQERTECHSRSDSGLSSLSSWTQATSGSGGTKSGSSSVRSSSIVSDCSSKIEELLDDQTQ